MVESSPTWSCNTSRPARKFFEKTYCRIVLKAWFENVLLWQTQKDIGISLVDDDIDASVLDTKQIQITSFEGLLRDVPPSDWQVCNSLALVSKALT